MLLLCGTLAVFYGCTVSLLALLRVFDPPTTAMQLERQLSARWEGRPYRKRCEFQPLGKISLSLQHAVIASEDARFYQHNGIDWRQVEAAALNEEHRARMRGASTIDQQLIKNLFLSSSRSPVRKAFEATLLPFEQTILGKRRILELYLNVVEWGDGIYGAEAAAQHYYGISAAQLSREQSAALAALLPAPLHRTPQTVHGYTNRILVRMRQMAW